MAKIEITRMMLGQIMTNVYLACNSETKEGFIVDPADGAEQIIKRIEAMEMIPKAILLTHEHFDHILAVNELKKKLGIPVYAGRLALNMLGNPSLNMSIQTRTPVTISPDTLLDDLQVFELAGFKIQYLSTPGHTPGSGCYYLEEPGCLFSGDTLFRYSVGRTDFPGGSYAQILNSLHRLLSSLPDDVTVLPGHDRATTIGAEKEGNPFV